MSINWSSAVELFKQHGKLWYYAAQKLPIESYKDIILMYEFCYNVMSIATYPDAKERMNIIIQQRHKDFRNKSIDNPEYGGMIEIMLRSNITEQPIKDFFQSILLYIQHVRYQSYDELKVYVGGIAEGIGIMVADVVGCAPPGHPHAQAMGESMWLMHMMLEMVDDYHEGRNYLPRADMLSYGVSDQDIANAVKSRTCTIGMRNLVKYYVDEHEQLSTYAVRGIGYISKTGHIGISDLINVYERYVVLIQRHNYNIFHPRFQTGLKAKLIGYPIYWYNNLLGSTT